MIRIDIGLKNNTMMNFNCDSIEDRKGEVIIYNNGQLLFKGLRSEIDYMSVVNIKDPNVIQVTYIHDDPANKGSELPKEVKNDMETNVRKRKR